MTLKQGLNFEKRVFQSTFGTIKKKKSSTTTELTFTSSEQQQKRKRKENFKNFYRICVFF